MTTELSIRQTPAPPVARNAWTRPGFVAAAGVMALVAVAGVSLAVLPSDHAPPAAVPNPAASEGKAATGSDSVCGLPAGGQSEPSTAPRAHWELVGRIAAPSAPGIGPGRVNGAQRSCYAHSPVGALYAAANGLAAFNNPAAYGWAAENLLATGPGRNKAVGDARALAKAKALNDLPPGTAQMQGFQFVSTDPNTVVIDLAFRQSIPGTPDVLGHKIATLRWQGGDWKLVADSTGNPYYGKTNLRALTGYVPWSGL